MKNSLWIAVLPLLALCVASSAAAAATSPGLQPVASQGGGYILEGRVNAAAFPRSGLGEVLQQVHQRAGARPNVGRVMSEKDGSRYMAFFDVVSNGQPYSGLVMVSRSPQGEVRGAVLYDVSARFPKTFNPMLKQLRVAVPAAAPAGNGAANGAASGAGNSGTARTAGAPVPPMHRVVYPDNSGSVELPDGWKIVQAASGAAVIRGTRGERIAYGLYWPIMDPNNPQQRQMMMMETRNGQLPLPGMYTAVAYTGNVVQEFLEAQRQLARKQHLPPTTYSNIRTEPAHYDDGTPYTLMRADMNPNDGTGDYKATLTLWVTPPNNGLWSIMVSQFASPVAVAEKQVPTMTAIVNSFRSNDQVIMANSNAEVARIRQIGADSMQRARDSNAAFDAKLANDRRNEDIRDRSNANFSYYLRDQTVVLDTQTGDRGPVSNGYADSLVGAAPDRYQYVPTQDYLKGLDY